MKDIDQKVVIKRLQQLMETVAALEKQRKCSKEEFLTSLDLQWIVEHGLQLSIQQIIDLSSHLLVASGLNNVDNYTDVIEKLVKHRIIPKALGKKIIPMINFRNILVHEYAVVDPKKVYAILQNDLRDFELFARAVSRFLKKKIR